MEDEFFTGDEVIVVEGEFKGQFGLVTGNVPAFDQYFVLMPEVDPERGHLFEKGEIQHLDYEESEPDDKGETPGFGMDAQQFAAHLEFLITRSLDRVPTVGPANAFFGYQEFEGLTAEEALLLLLTKIEEGIAHLAQAHILISRIGVSYRTLIKEIINENT